MPTAQSTGERRYDFHTDKLVDGGLTYLTMHGTLNEAFDSRKLSGSIRTKKLIINMRDVSRFASWGMSEWMEFLRVTSDCDTYLVECSTYAVSQLILITGLLSHAKLVSFYAAYRCTKCGTEQDRLFVIPRDRAGIRDIPTTSEECKKCNGRAKLEEYPASFFDTVAARPPFDVDDEALAFMRSRLRYDLSPDLTRFRAYRRVHKDFTYLRLTGNIATLPPDLVARGVANTTVLDLGGVVFEPGQTSGFRTFVEAAKPKAHVIQLLDCPPRFLDTALRPEDLDDKLKVRTFGVLHRCRGCATLSTQLVDVAANLEQLVIGEVPPAECPACRAQMIAALDADEVAMMRALPARNRDPALDTFVAKSRTEPADKLENWLLTGQTVAAPAGRKRGMYVAAGAVIVLAGGAGAAVVVTKLSNRSATAVVAPSVADAAETEQQPAFTRPAWIQSDAPATGSCSEVMERLVCVGVSSYRDNRDDGVGEASDAALEALVNAVALKVPTPYFRETVIPGYSDVRNKALSAQQNATANRDFDRNTAAANDESVRKARRRVVTVLESTGGAAVPAQRSDWYWEEYANDAAKGSEFLVFVRFDVSRDAVHALVEKYSSTTSVLGATVMTAFPALAWRWPTFNGGAQVTKVGDRLASAGIAANRIVTAVDETRIVDATSFAGRVQETRSGELKLTVLDGNGAEQVVTVKRDKRDKSDRPDKSDKADKPDKPDKPDNK